MVSCAIFQNKSRPHSQSRGRLGKIRLTKKIKDWSVLRENILCSECMRADIITLWYPNGSKFAVRMLMKSMVEVVMMMTVLISYDAQRETCL